MRARSVAAAFQSQGQGHDRDRCRVLGRCLLSCFALLAEAG
jgi:hypothetical protein